MKEADKTVPKYRGEKEKRIEGKANVSECERRE